MSLSESQFERVADETLTEMVERLSDLEDDAFDADLESGVLTIEFTDGQKYVINSHRAARQIWVAMGASAWHFDWVEGDWRSTRGDDELWSLVQQGLTSKLNRPIELGRG